VGAQHGQVVRLGPAPGEDDFAGIGAQAGGDDVAGLVLAPGFMMIDERGQFEGLSAAGFNYVKGTQRGFTIGVVNYARRLHGVQVGLINYARNNPPGLRVLPLLNVNLSDSR
jgi:hypothetical protein